MKVICVNNISDIGLLKKQMLDITLYKIYNVMVLDNPSDQAKFPDTYYIINDNGSDMYYSKHLFKTLDTYREELIDEILWK